MRTQSHVIGSEAVIDLRHGLRSVAVVGLGYVGLPTALAFADAGLDVIGVDASAERLDAIRARRVDLVPADAARLARLDDERRLCLTVRTMLTGATDAVVICVPTPVDEGLRPDLRSVSAACTAAVEHAQRGQILVLTSTTYVGCTRELLVEPLQARGLRVGEDVFVAFAPERIDPANSEFSQCDVPRVVGGATPSCTERAARLIGIVSPVHRVSSLEAAELTKLHENTFRAVNIALANELADIAGELGLDVTEVIDAAATKPFGFMPFRPGPGVGGHCIPCDPHYLLWQLGDRDASAPLVTRAMESIGRRPLRVVERALGLLADRTTPVMDARVLIVGAAYKPGVQDVREAPALKIVAELLERGAHVDVHDPLVGEIHTNGSDAVLHTVSAPDPADYDLVIALTLHPGHDYGWLARAERLLDATYQLRGREAVVVV